MLVSKSNFTTRTYQRLMIAGVFTFIGTASLFLNQHVAHADANTQPTQTNTTNGNETVATTAESTNPQVQNDSQVKQLNQNIAQQQQNITTYQNEQVADQQLSINKVGIDKARYNPGDAVTFNIDAKNPVNATATAHINVQIFQGNTKIDSVDGTQTINPNTPSQTVNVTWQSKNNDFQGYMAYIYVNGKQVGTQAIDVSSTWTKYPRYGSLTTFKQSDDAQNKQRITDMKDNYVNAMQYYDAYQTSQNPIPSNTNSDTFTQDWDPWLSQENRTKSISTIKNAVNTGHQYNMSSLYYNMIYAFTGSNTDANYLKSIGVNPSWILYHADGADKDKAFSGNMAPWIPNNPATTQTFLNIANPDVQRWAYERIKPLLENGYNFDGWHGDTIGENGPMYTINADESHSQTLYMSDYLGTFANSIKQMMAQDGLGNKQFGVNTVGNVGQVKGEWRNTVDTSNADFQYSETWDADLSRIDSVIKSTYKNSGKSLIVPDYVQYDEQNKQGKQVNINSVLMLDAFVYAAGGSRLESVDGNQFIQGGYFPTQDLSVSDDLKQQFHTYQTFITAYENYLRDGQVDLYPNGGGMALYNTNGRPMAISQPATSNDSKKNSVYVYARTNGKTQTIQMINFNGITDLDPHGNSGNQVAPIEQDDFWVQYYPDSPMNHNGSNPIKSITLVTPDGNNANKVQNIPVEWKQDNVGNWYLNIPINYLQRWDMLILSPDDAHNQDYSNANADVITTQQIQLTDKQNLINQATAQINQFKQNKEQRILQVLIDIHNAEVAKAKADAEAKAYRAFQADKNHHYLSFVSPSQNKKLLKTFKKHGIKAKLPIMKIIKSHFVGKNYINYTVKINGHRISFTIRRGKLTYSYYSPFKLTSKFYVKIKRGVVLHKTKSLKGHKAYKVKAGRKLRIKKVVTYKGITRFELSNHKFITANKYYVKVV